MSNLIIPYLEEIIKLALMEDIGCGDITTQTTIPPDFPAYAQIVVKEDCIVAGLEVVKEVYRIIDPLIELTTYKNDGETAEKGSVIATLRGKARSILTGERVSLNFLQRLSGVATQTRIFVNLIKGTSAKITDTRKTTPNLRALEKYAVRVGGGFNHRMSLDGGILIKQNHIKVVGSIKNAVKKAKANSPHPFKIEVEVKSFDEVKEAMEAGAHMILMDNMEVEDMKKVIDFCNWKIETEASGNITLKNVREIAEIGVDYISIGALTRSSLWIDISLYIM